jgi:hypothetical protein
MSSLPNEADEQLAPFLRQLADSIDSDKLSPEQMQQVGEFYMSYKVRNENTDTDPEELEEMDFIRFLTLGLYIYRFILNEDGTHINGGEGGDEDIISADYLD